MFSDKELRMSFKMTRTEQETRRFSETKIALQLGGAQYNTSYFQATKEEGPNILSKG
jgi:hypothetical protein